MSRRLVLATLSRMGPLTAREVAVECTLPLPRARNICSTLVSERLAEVDGQGREGGRGGRRQNIYAARAAMVPQDRESLRDMLGCYGAKLLHSTLTELDR